jgi:hypothetical protein
LRRARLGAKRASLQTLLLYTLQTLRMDPTTARISDPLSPLTRKNRSWLLGISLLGVLFVQVGLIPETLSFFGTEFKQWDNTTLIVVAISVCIFYLISFIVSSMSDYYTYRMKIFSADTLDDQTYEELLHRWANDALTEQDKILLYRNRTNAWIYNSSNWLARARLTVELVLPIIFGIYSIVVMTNYAFVHSIKL